MPWQLGDASREPVEKEHLGTVERVGYLGEIDGCFFGVDTDQSQHSNSNDTSFMSVYVPIDSLIAPLVCVSLVCYNVTSYSVRSPFV